MPRRHPLPRLWLLTDPRQGEALWPALARLRSGAGVIVRHYGAADRRSLFAQVRRIARRRRLVLLLAGNVREAVAWRADGCYGPDRRRSSPRAPVKAMPAHDRVEIIAAGRAGATLVLLSPVHRTRSHPGERVLGRVRFAALTRAATMPVVALGGMTAQRAKAIPAYGWAAIDGWIRT